MEESTVVIIGLSNGSIGFGLTGRVKIALYVRRWVFSLYTGEQRTKQFNSFSSAAEIIRAKPTWYFAGSYLRFSACYVDENNTIRFSEKFPIDTYNKMSTL